MEAFSDVKVWLFTVIATPLMLVTETYLFEDWEYLKWLMLLMFLDLVTGVLRAFLKKVQVTSKGLRQTVIKVIQYFIFLITIHVLTNFKIQGVEVELFAWITTSAYAFLIGIEAKSILENLAGFNDTFDATALIDKLKDVLPKKKGE